MNVLRLLIASLLVSLCLPNKIRAEGAPQNTNIAGPSASATGNVTNQAIQTLNGPFPISTFGAGVSCPGPTLNITPFLTTNTNYSYDPGTSQSFTGGLGGSISISIPLDSQIQDLCKQRAMVAIARQEAETDKARLDFELVRALRCGEMKRNGIQFHPNSPYAAICADIVVINTPVTPTNNETPVSQGQRTEVPAASKRQTY